MVSRLLDRVLLHEGFESEPYPDPLLGWEKPTFGHGLTYITEEESKFLAQRRLKAHYKALCKAHNWLTRRPVEAQEVVTEMAYQMGTTGCLNFRKMWAALKSKDYDQAANEMLDSLWAKQTPNRAKDLSEIMRNVEGHS